MDHTHNHLYFKIVYYLDLHFLKGSSNNLVITAHIVYNRKLMGIQYNQSRHTTLVKNMQRLSLKKIKNNLHFVSPSKKKNTLNILCKQIPQKTGGRKSKSILIHQYVITTGGVGLVARSLLPTDLVGRRTWAQSLGARC